MRARYTAFAQAAESQRSACVALLQDMRADKRKQCL